MSAIRACSARTPRRLRTWLVSGGGEWLAVGGLLLLTAICFWRILDTFFVQDDFALLVRASKPMPNVDMLRGACFVRPLFDLLADAAERLALGPAPVLPSRHVSADVPGHGGGFVRLAPRADPLAAGGALRRHALRLLEDPPLHPGLDRRRDRRFRGPVLRPLSLGRQPRAANVRRWRSARPVADFGRGNHLRLRTAVQGIVRGNCAGVPGVDRRAKVRRPAAVSTGRDQARPDPGRHPGRVSRRLALGQQPDRLGGGSVSIQARPRDNGSCRTACSLSSRPTSRACPSRAAGCWFR